MKLRLIKNRTLTLLVLALTTLACQEEDLFRKTSQDSTVLVETIDGSKNVEFIKLLSPLQRSSLRQLSNQDLKRVKRITGANYVTYSFSIPQQRVGEGIYHSIVVSSTNDTVSYNLMELIPDPNWDGGLTRYQGVINNYSLLLSTTPGSSNRVLTETPVSECMQFVIDDVEYNSDNQAYAVGHWEEDPDCVESGGGSPDSGGFNWAANWGSNDPGNWSPGTDTNPNGSSSNPNKNPDKQSVPISIEDYFAEQLKKRLSRDPFALIDIPCEELSQAWKELAEHKPNQAVKDRIQQLNQEGYDIEMQYLEDATGAIVNMDYFPVEISQLPENPETGETFTGQEFFNYIRKNFADICFNDNTSFGPYNQTEAQRWNSTNYLGTVMRFDIAVSLFGIFPGQQDGSVLCTDQQNQSWIFSTIYTSQDHSHPVSGNRQFGLTANPDGTYTFYTAGVDRVAESFDDLVSELPNTAGAFEGGEEIWSSLQNNLKNFINDTENGGTATVGESSIERIDIEELEAVLNGTKSVSDLGCN